MVKLNGQNDYSNRGLLNENATKSPSSSSSSLIRKSQRLTKSNNKNSIDFHSPKYTNLSGKVKTADNYYNKKFINNHHPVYENKAKHSTTDPQLATDILSATMYDMRTSYLLSNDDVKDDEDNDEDVVVALVGDDIDKENDSIGTRSQPLPPTSLSRKAFLDDVNSLKRHQQQQQQRQKESYRTNIDQKKHHHHNHHHHHPHQKEQNHLKQTVDVRYNHHDKLSVQPIHPESRVVKFKPIILHNPLSVSSSQQTSSMTVAPPSCWSSQSYSDLPQSTSTSIQDKYSTLRNPSPPPDRLNSAVHCWYTGDNICKKSVKQPIQSSHEGGEDEDSNEAAMIATTETIHRNILPNTEN
ncbi:unnamed protein product, partial [Trichobilharzia regenti]